MIWIKNKSGIENPTKKFETRFRKLHFYSQMFIYLLTGEMVMIMKLNINYLNRRTGLNKVQIKEHIFNRSSTRIV